MPGVRQRQARGRRAVRRRRRLGRLPRVRSLPGGHPRLAVLRRRTERGGFVCWWPGCAAGADARVGVDILAHLRVPPAQQLRHSPDAFRSEMGGGERHRPWRQRLQRQRHRRGNPHAGAGYEPHDGRSVPRARARLLSRGVQCLLRLVGDFGAIGASGRRGTDCHGWSDHFQSWRARGGPQRNGGEHHGRRTPPGASRADCRKRGRRSQRDPHP
mmetsp:Transcript_49330/g.116578  ORF Transcript_49330/g.116578 Transcript_49330/m.116578 type:complete len:214 (-) Transcript_49330:197-838(-)